MKCYRTTGNEPGTSFRRVTFLQKKFFLVLFLLYVIIISNRMIRKLSRCMEKEFYEEFEDMEAGIDQKQALVEESKKS